MTRGQTSVVYAALHPVRLHIVAESNHRVVPVVLDRVIAQLGAAGVDARWGTRLPRQIRDDDVVIAHEPLARPPERGCVLGQRLLNRRQRLVVLAHAAVPVAPWAAPRDGRGVVALFDRWGVETILYKADWSWRRKGVLVVRRDDTLGYDPTGDVFMQILGGDPDTYKVDLFRDVVLGARVYRTPSAHDPRFHHDPHPSSPYQPSRRLREISQRAGSALARYGSGYLSLDFMRAGGRWVLIEANISGVGIVDPWRMRPHQYADRYAAGVLAWLGARESRPALSTLRRRCAGVDRLAGAFDASGARFRRARRSAA